MQRSIKSFIINIFIPFIIGFIGAFQLYQSKALIANLQNIIGNMIGIMATLFGFIITALSILLTVQGNEKTEQIRNSHHYKSILLTYLIAAFYMLVGLLIFIVTYSFTLINKVISFVYLFFVIISFIYLILTLLYLGIIIITLFHEKQKYY